MKFNIPKTSKRISVALLPAGVPFHSLLRITGPFGAIARIFNYAPFTGTTKLGELKTSFSHLLRDYQGLMKLYRQRLNLHGVGYKSYAPKVYSRSSFVLRVGFGASEMKYDYPSLIKGRAKKQRLILLSSIYDKLRNTAAEVVQLKRADPYKGKGIRFLGQGYKQKQGKVRSR